MMRDVIKHGAALLLVLAGAGCASHDAPKPAASTAQWRIALTSAPAFPRQLDPAQLNVQIADSSGRPVSGASVTVQLAMPTMDMGQNQVTAQAGAAGIYTATGRFTMPGDWQVTVQADKGALHQSQSFPITVR
jgi:nitrogen fixation protein FixH